MTEYVWLVMQDEDGYSDVIGVCRTPESAKALAEEHYRQYAAKLCMLATLVYHLNWTQESEETAILVAEMERPDRPDRLLRTMYSIGRWKITA